MGRAPTPTAVLEARGAFLNHPERQRPAEVKPQGQLSAEPPESFSKAERKVWRQFVRGLPPGLATEWDFYFVVPLVKLISKEFAGTIKTAERAQMITLGAKFGMTPADRAKIAIEAPKESKIQKFLKTKPVPTAPPAEPVAVSSVQ